jgi:hypothetical protein
MNARRSFACPLKAQVSGFLGLLAIIATLAAARGIGFLEADAARRAIGLVIGVMVVVVGNFLPKLRPLGSPGGNSAEATAAERSAGWVLVLAGITYIALFAVAPLDKAALLSSVLGIGALVVIAANWVRLALRTLFVDGKTPKEIAPSRQAWEKRKLAISLLFGFLYVFIGASVAFLLHDKPAARHVASWAILWLGLAYAILYAVLESRGARPR